jgi:cold shock CspA family protein
VTGTVKMLSTTFGFIRGEDAVDYFFHAGDEVDDDVELRVGDRVSFEAVEPAPAKGPRARAASFVDGAHTSDRLGGQRESARGELWPR